MESKQPIARGARYRDVQTTVFGQPQPESIVEGVYRVSDGIDHARLVSAADPSARKPLSLAALRDRRRSVRVLGYRAVARRILLEVCIVRLSRRAMEIISIGAAGPLADVRRHPEDHSLGS